MRRVFAIVKFMGIAGVAAVIVPLQIMAALLHKPAARRLPKVFHKAMLSIIGMKVTVSGAPVTGQPTFFVSNHLSYLDIIVLGSRIDTCFAAKSEVANWPFFGVLARAGRTVFLERERRSRTRHQRDTLIDRLATGDNIVLFPEGSSNNGCTIGHFKSALLSVAEGQMPGGGQPMVQPVLIVYAGIHGLATSRSARTRFVWYSGIPLLPHLFKVMQIGPCEARIFFLPPVRATDFASRKHLARHCQDEVSVTFGQVLQGLAPVHS